MDLLVYLSPLWILFEVAQLLVAERLLGVRQIERGDDPRARGPGEVTAFFGTAGIVLYWGWMILMLIPKPGRIQVACMLLVALVGYALRRNARLKWILVILTLEGAVRIGLLISLVGAAWRRL